MKNEKSNHPIPNDSTTATEIWLDKQDILIRMHITQQDIAEMAEQGYDSF